MRHLKAVLEASLLGDIENTLNTSDYDTACVVINEFIKNNYHTKQKYKIKKRPNKDGKYIVNFAKNGYVELLESATSFTNDLFVIGFCNVLTIRSNNIVNLVGAPETVCNLHIENCHNFQSFEGMPKFLTQSSPTLSLRNLAITDLMSLDKYLNIPEEIRLLIANCQKLTSLKGCPTKLNDLTLAWCDSLKNLSGGPDYVNNIELAFCKGLQSLEGCPKHIGDGKWIHGIDINNCNKLTSLEGCPDCINGVINIEVCEKIMTLEGCPKHVNSFSCRSLPIVSLKGAPEIVDNLFCVDLCDNFTSLEGCPKVVKGKFAIERCMNINFTENDIKTICQTDKIYFWANGKNSQL